MPKEWCSALEEFSHERIGLTICRWAKKWPRRFAGLSSLAIAVSQRPNKRARYIARDHAEARLDNPAPAHTAALPAFQ